MDDGGTTRQGAVAALAALGPGLEAEFAPAEQASMFDEPDAPLPVSPAKLGRGRPAGSQNRSTEEWKRLLLGRYRSPLVGLLEIAARSPKDLARELELFRVDEDGEIKRNLAGEPLLAHDALVRAFDRQVGALQAALPYLHQKLPQAVEISEKPRGTLVINLGGYGEVPDDLALPLARTQQNQEVTDAEIVASDSASVGHPEEAQ